MEGLCNIFTSEAVAGFDAELLRELTSEPDSVSRERKINEEKLESLKASYAVCIQHVDGFGKCCVYRISTWLGLLSDSAAVIPRSNPVPESNAGHATGSPRQQTAPAQVRSSRQLEKSPTHSQMLGPDVAPMTPPITPERSPDGYDQQTRLAGKSSNPHRVTASLFGRGMQASPVTSDSSRVSSADTPLPIRSKRLSRWSSPFFSDEDDCRVVSDTIDGDESTPTVHILSDDEL